MRGVDRHRGELYELDDRLLLYSEKSSVDSLLDVDSEK
jgi:hypothetical protein